MIKNIILFIVTTLITLGITEAILRFSMEDYLYPCTGSRILYYGEHTFTTEKNKAVHYAPNKLIRSIAVYYNKIEYDTKHHSNNFGFLSDKDYLKENKRGIIFLGDSFTAGVGSTTPWISTLDKKYKEINLYSLGVTGTGIENFYRTYEYFQNKINYDTVVVMAISDDFTRPLWQPVEKNKIIYFKYNGKEKPIIHTIPSDIDSQKVLHPEQLYLIKAYKVLKEGLAKSTKNKKVLAGIPRQQYNNAFASLKKIKELSSKNNKKVIFIHLLEKGEQRKVKYRLNLKNEIEEMGIDYYSIIGHYRFNASMYHTHDGHPNDKGYQQISKIVEDILKLK